MVQLMDFDWQTGDFMKGRGAQIRTANPFEKNTVVREHPEALDEELIQDIPTEYLYDHARKIVNRVDSPDVPLDFSLNPYQGCEHGCVYCYARNTHEYWGYSAGLDFEQKIIIKENAAQLLRDKFDSRRWKPKPIMVAGNTDCYQPAERKLEITRSLLKVFLDYRNPVGLITKNSLIERDIDILKELNKMDLVHVAISITTLDEDVRQKLEPRTSTSRNRLRTVRRLSDAGIPVNVMVAPIIPGLTNHEAPDIIKAAADAGARGASYVMLRLNGRIAEIFTDWVRKTFPDRSDKILRQVAEMHGGNLNDSQFGRRMRGQGNVADAIRDLFEIANKRYFAGRVIPPYNLEAFRRPSTDGQLSLF